MKPQLLTVLTLGLLSSATSLPSYAQEMDEVDQTSPTVTTQEMFRCDVSQDPARTVITGMTNPENGNPVTLMNWSAQYFQSENEAQSLCQDVSQQLQTLYEAGELTNFSMVSGEWEGETVVCLKEGAEANCQRDRVLFTLDPSNSEAVLSELIAAEFKPAPTRGDYKTDLEVKFTFLDLLKSLGSSKENQES
ncbi:COP23 domain-containing protein [Halothece sp. PCC 7418]|uniref:COP23 domain-containing protein n=1 Tax=Halothece sp. (strain PCC 7418) TaxID=65093 RepID=UPI0002EB37EF|nr:COP23 domain-containing protein [Halothece sp. PCC 7418]